MVLADDLETAIRNALCWSHLVAPTDRTTEIDALHELFSRGLPEIIGHVNKHHAKLVHIAGVYCHQRPYVQWPPGGPKAGRCELGDLLLVVNHVPSSARIAVLLQLKVDGRAAPAGDQKVLYEEWPTFEYDMKPRDTRAVTSTPSPHDGGRYGEIRFCPGCARTRPPAPCRGHERLKVEQLTQTQTRERPLSDIMAAAISGRMTGAPVMDWHSARATIGWDRVVWDLLTRSANAKYNYRLRGRTVSGQARFQANWGVVEDAAGPVVGFYVVSDLAPAVRGGPAALARVMASLSAKEPASSGSRDFGDDPERPGIVPLGRAHPPDGGIPFIFIESSVPAPDDPAHE